jgi:colanic acid/amylovoran biosynthesis glycosyltransferase
MLQDRAYRSRRIEEPMSGPNPSPLRVAFFVHSFPSASETFIIGAAKAVIRAGHQLDIYALDPTTEDPAALPEDVQRYGLVNRLHEARVPQSAIGKPLGLLAAAVTNVSVLQGGGRRLLSLPPRYGMQNAVRGIFDATAFPRPAAYDVLHCHFGTLAGRVLRLRDAGVVDGKVLVHFRGYDISRYIKEAGEDAYREVFAAADWFVANCDFFRQRALALGAPEDRTTIVPSGLDLDMFPYTPRTAPEDGIPRLITVGRLVEKKGIPYILDALAQCREAGRHFDYEIVGDGPDRAALEAQVEKLALGDRVRFSGAASLDRIADKLSAAHLFAGPSVTSADGDQDATTNVLKEAMASGLPVIATWHGGIPELVADGQSGYLVPERDVAALARALLRLADAPEDWAAMGRAGHEAVKARYSQAQSTAAMLHAYQAMLGD